MQPVAWSAVMIGPSVDGHGAARLRTEFRLDEGHGEVATARLHVSAHGVVESYLAGVPVSSDVLTPGFSSFEWRLRYRTYDVASALQSAAHGGDAVVLGLEVGHGWYRGRLCWTNERAVYGDQAVRSPSSRSRTSTDTPSASSPMVPGPRDRPPCWLTTSTTARRSTPDSATGPGCAPASTTRPGRRRTSVPKPTCRC